MENCLDAFRSYVHEIGEKLKIENLDLDEENNCYLAFDGKYFVKCSINGEKEQLNFLAYIGALPADETRYYLGLLESNYFWKDTAGANLSLDPEDGTLLLTQYCNMNMLDSELFYKTLEKFVNAMEHWDTKRLEEWNESPEKEGDASGSAPAMGSDQPGMMMFGA
ncbi:MAG: type III secretion system chaperone [Puniceicoccales bacterium]|nr:type III secretion system chaperone [Puniceicoccales bacterium]